MPASPSTANTEPTTRAVNLRVREEIRDLIDQAAKIQGQSRSAIRRGRNLPGPVGSPDTRWRSGGTLPAPESSERGSL